MKATHRLSFRLRTEQDPVKRGEDAPWLIADLYVAPEGGEPTRLELDGLVSAINSREPQRAGLDHLLGDGPPDWYDARGQILRCRACGDPECGALTCQVVRAGGLVSWVDVRETTGHPEDPPPAPEAGPTYVFDSVELRETVEAAVAAVNGRPYSTLPLWVTPPIEAPWWDRPWGWWGGEPPPPWPPEPSP